MLSIFSRSFKWESTSMTFYIPKVTDRSSYRNFLTGTCPLVTVRTAGPLAPVLAQYKMWNHDPWGGTDPWVRGMDTWHQPFFTDPPIYLKKPDRDQDMEPCPYCPRVRLVFPKPHPSRHTQAPSEIRHTFIIPILNSFNWRTRAVGRSVVLLPYIYMCIIIIIIIISYFFLT